MRDVTVAVLIALVLIALSVPYQFDFAYWVESPVAWIVSAVLGVIAALCALLLYLRSQHLLTREGTDGEEDGS